MILHLTRDFPPRSNGGLSRAVGDLVREAWARDVPCEVLSCDGWRKGAPATDLPPQARVHRLPRSERAALREQVEALSPRVIVAHDALLLDALWPSGVAWTTPVALVTHVVQARQSEVRGLRAPTRSEQAERAAIARAQRVIAPSLAAAADLSRLYPEAAVCAAPLGVLRPESVGERGVTTLYAARFGDLKGTDRLAEAWPTVAAKSSTDLSVAGGLPDHRRADAKWRERLGALPRTQLLGWLDGEALEEAYRSAGVVAAPSRYETFSLTVAEAMARGRCVVASDIAAHRELIEHGVTGLLHSGERGALADALIAAQDSALGARVAAAAREASAAFEWSARIDRHLELWR